MKDAGTARSLDLRPLPLRVLKWTLVITTHLTLLHVLLSDVVFIQLLSLDTTRSVDLLRGLLSLESEQGVATWFSVVLLLSCGVTLILISTRANGGHAPPRVAWFSLGLIFIAMSIDEQIGFHEVLSVYLEDLLETGGILQIAWVIPGTAFATLTGLLYWRFFKTLAWPYPLLFFGSGAIFLSGALLAEMFEGLLYSRGDDLSLSYVLQDPLEMAGASIFLYALLRYSVDQLGWRTLTLGS